MTAYSHRSLKDGRNKNIIGNQGVRVRIEVFAKKLLLPLFKRLLDVDQAIFLCGERLAHDDPPAKEAPEPRKALLCRTLQANDVRPRAIGAITLRDGGSQV